MRRRNWNTDHTARTEPPAGCLSSVVGWGDEHTDSIDAPEYKAMATKGIPLAGKITLAQYECLVGNGYDGNVVMRWTQNHAAQEIRKRNLVLRRPTPKPNPWKSNAAAPMSPARPSTPAPAPRRPDPQAPWPICPECKVKVKSARRLAQHLERVHRKSPLLVGRAAPRAIAKAQSQQDIVAARPEPPPEAKSDPYSPERTGPGEFWDARLWDPPPASGGPTDLAGVPLRTPKPSSRPGGLTVQYDGRGGWRRIASLGGSITVLEAAQILGVSPFTLSEWAQKVDASGEVTLPQREEQSPKSQSPRPVPPTHKRDKVVAVSVRPGSRGKRKSIGKWLDQTTTRYAPGDGVEELKTKGPGWWHGGE